MVLYFAILGIALLRGEGENTMKIFHVSCPLRFCIESGPTIQGLKILIAYENLVRQSLSYPLENYDTFLITGRLLAEPQ